MKITHRDLVKKQTGIIPGAQSVDKQILLGRADGVPTFSMRLFSLKPGGYSPRHQHPFEHLIYVLEGRGLAVGGEGETPLVPGNVMLVEPGEEHQLKNDGDTDFCFLCLVPRDYE